MILKGQENALVRSLNEQLTNAQRSIIAFKEAVERDSARGRDTTRWEFLIEKNAAVAETLEAAIGAVRFAASESAAFAACFETLDRAERESDRQDAEELERNAQLAKTYDTREEAVADGVRWPYEYHCYSCGCSFWAEWRSRYSPSPKCPICLNEDF